MKENHYKTLQYIAIACFLAIVAACVPFIKWGNLDPVRTLGLVAVIAFFEAWRIQFPWGRPLRLGMAATLCIIAIRPMPEVVWVFLLGSLLGRALSRVQKSEPGDFFHIVQRTYVVALAALVFQFIGHLGWHMDWNAYPATFYGPGPANATTYFTYYNPIVLQRAFIFPVAFVVMAAAFYLGEALTSSLEIWSQMGGSFRVTLMQHMRQTFLPYLALAGAAVLMALYFPRLPWFNFLIFFIPLLVVRLESNRDRDLDDRYFQTMRVIGDAFDLARGIPGHSSRVSNLADEVARDMALPGDEVRNIRYAAALHDIGYIEGNGGDEVGHAERGARVLEDIPRLNSIANIVRYAHPLSEEEGISLRVPAGSKIIGAVSDYDLLTNHPTKKLSPQEALEEMSVERGRRYDSIVLRTLSQVVEFRARARRGPEREISQKASVLEDAQLGESLEEIFREKE
jgi:HD domain